jgi:site-specific recombinase
MTLKRVLMVLADDITVRAEREETAKSLPPSPEHLINLVEAVRPGKVFVRKRREFATERLRELVNLLRSDEELRIALRTYLSDLLFNAYHIPLYTESGILPQSGFFSEGFQKIAHWILPPLYEASSLRGLVNLAFHESDDYVWFEAIPETLLVELLVTLDFIGIETVNIHEGWYHQLLNAALTLSHKIAAMGVEPEISSRLPEFEELESPFVAQHAELARYVEFIRSTSIHPRDADSLADDHALVMLAQCEDCVEYLRKRRDRFGASLELTYQMQRIAQHVARLKALIKLTLRPDDYDPNAFARRVVRLWREVVEAENVQHSLSKHINDLTGLLAFQVSENAAKRGEHYITVTREEYKNFFLSSLGGGFIVAFLAMIKLFWYYRHFPPFEEALAYGLTYAIGFIAIHLLGFILATKQPAMTASTIAESLDTKKNAKAPVSATPRRDEISLQSLVVMISQISRSQLISFVGNVAMSFPMGLLVGCIFTLLGVPLADMHKAEKMIAELHPFASGSLVYAGIAGVLLFMAGLISGYYDNKVVHNHIPERIRRHPFLRRILSKPALESFAGYIENNLGALAGNFALGLMLGSVATVGFIVGLPIDIRHITFAAANAGIALASLRFDVSASQTLWTFAGIIGVGMMNFLVSFSLALTLALRSRRVNFRRTAELIQLLWRYFRTHTGEFFFPPKNISPQIATHAEKPHH